MNQWVNHVAHSSTELSVGTVCFFHHYQQGGNQNQNTATGNIGDLYKHTNQQVNT